MNGDGFIDVLNDSLPNTPADASLILQSVVGLRGPLTDDPLQITRADVSSNGTVTAYDAGLILQRLVGFITRFPVEDTLGLPKALSTRSGGIVTLDIDRAIQMHDDVGPIVLVPLMVSGTSDVLSLEADFVFDARGLEFLGVEPTPLSALFLVESQGGLGHVSVALAGAQPLDGDGDVLLLRFREILEGGLRTLAPERILLNEESLEVVGEAGVLPLDFSLDQNYPNPFNPQTSIRYSLAESRPVTLTIYNILGQEVRTLIHHEVRDAGVFTIVWNGDNNAGLRVASGIYLYRFVAGDFVKTRKLMLLR